MAGLAPFTAPVQVHVLTLTWQGLLATTLPMNAQGLDWSVRGYAAGTYLVEVCSGAGRWNPRLVLP